MKIKNCACTFVFLAFILTFAILLVALPHSDYSENEKRVLAEFPEFTPKSVMDGSFTKGLETYINDHFPCRDLFVGIHAYYNQLIGRGNASGIYSLSDGSLVSAPAAVDEGKCNRNLAMLESFADKLSLPTAIIIMPSAGYIKSEQLPFGAGEYSDDLIFASAGSTFGDVELIDLRELYKNEESSGKDIYYNTDHHVTSYGSYLAYLEYCKLRGITPTEGHTDIEVLHDFYGTGYSQSGLWLTRPDTLEIWHSPLGYSFCVTVDDITEKKTFDGLYVDAHREKLDKYPVFLDGNHAITTITNESLEEGKTLLIVKDSYAHCFSTFACDQYKTVCLVDLRYYRGSVSDVAAEIGADELLYIFGAENLATLSELALLR